MPARIQISDLVNLTTGQSGSRIEDMNVSRYTDATELRFDVEFVTPCFLGGADGNAEIRTSEFKYGIRYWWRLLYGAKYFDEEKLKDVEDFIFGSTEKKSLITICIEKKSFVVESVGFPNGRKVDVEHQRRTMQVNILDYLAYGKYEYVRGQGNRYNKTYIKPDSKVTLRIEIANSQYNDEIKDSIKMFFMWGGIGSKSRNGFGSMLANVQTIPFSKKSVLSAELKEFPVFSHYSKFYITKESFVTWEMAMSEVGCTYKDARTSLENKHRYNRRGFVARPIEVQRERIPENIRQGRIPKPFYMGVMKIGNKYFGYIILVPILFYERNNQFDYQRTIKDMETYISQEMRDDTQNFVSSFTGGTAK